MSVGCGPCTELAAVDYLKKKEILNYEKLRYREIDPLGSVWNRIWDNIIEYFGDGINFYQNDILELVDIIVRDSWIPDILIFQYMFSDMYKHSNMVGFDKISNEIKRAYNPFDSCAGVQILIKKGRKN